MAEVKAGPAIAADVDPATANVAIGGYVCHPAPIRFHDKLKVTVLQVRNTGDRPVQVGSHFHFFEVNRALEFDRGAAFGQHLNIPASTALRFEPGDEFVARLNRGHVDLVTSHSGGPAKRAATLNMGRPKGQCERLVALVRRGRCGT